MLFNSLHFLLFLPVVTILYYWLAPRYRWLLIFTASCYFYMVFVPYYILILFVIILIDFFSGIAIEGTAGRKRKLYLIISLCSNILLLGFFKYFNFFNENLSAVFSLFGWQFHPANLDIILPIGLSFHTFQSMSYTIEVYRGRQAAERHLGYFANYVLFFPQMVAGPIERYDRLGNELRQAHVPVYSNFADGFRLILFGLFVKMVVADNIAPFVNSVYADPAAHSQSHIFAAVVLFSFQIYADFYGYSTIAVGSARLLGIRIMDNFSTPYLSTSISEFWSRWHISLSTWFRDYLYIPLGGNRVKLPRWTFNILVVFMVSGLWHGASWTFVVWGAFHGVMLLLERYYRMIFGEVNRNKNPILTGLLVIKTFALSSFAWIFFRASSFSNAKQVIAGLFSGSDAASGDLDWQHPLYFAILLLCFDFYLYNSRVDRRLGSLHWPFRWAFYSVLLFCLMAIAGTGKFPFIYFQF
jgi:D-alanyl-lipoteichoic acid acyltransferase DltB (MBOAT superfamily)